MEQSKIDKKVDDFQKRIKLLHPDISIQINGELLSTPKELTAEANMLFCNIRIANTTIHLSIKKENPEEPIDFQGDVFIPRNIEVEPTYSANQIKIALDQRDISKIDYIETFLLYDQRSAKWYLIHKFVAFNQANASWYHFHIDAHTRHLLLKERIETPLS